MEKAIYKHLKSDQISVPVEKLVLNYSHKRGYIEINYQPIPYNNEYMVSMNEFIYNYFNSNLHSITVEQGLIITNQYISDIEVYFMSVILRHTLIYISV